MTHAFIKEQRVCRNSQCGGEYEARIIKILGATIVLGDGYCPECAMKAMRVEEAKDTAVRVAEASRKRRSWRYSCGVPPKFINEDFSTFNPKRHLDTSLNRVFKACQDYAEGYPLVSPQDYKSLVLFSGHSWGVGKTHLACAIAHRILDRWEGENIGCPVIFVSEPELYVRIQATYSFNREERQFRESEADIIRLLTGTGLLIIDDVGKRRVSDPKFVQRIMFSIIDGRYKAMLPIVLTANLLPDQLETYLGGGQEDEASFDRLIEMCQRVFWQLEGKSYRQEGH